jgi:hypothetical protein
MTLTITIDPSWLVHPELLGRLLEDCRALESPAPWMPPATRQPGDDGDEDDLSALLAGMDDPPPAAVATVPPRPPAPKAPAIPPPAAVPTTGSALYKWTLKADCLRKCNIIGKRKNWPSMITQWSVEQVAAAYRELIAPPAAPDPAPAKVNGRRH